jgi:hypothetical protein
MNKSRELGVSPGALEFYFATGRRYKGAKARGYGKPEEDVNDWDGLPSTDIFKGINKED